MKNPLENNESLELKTLVLSDEELMERIYKGESLPQDKRFLPTVDGGVFKYFNLEDIISFSSNGKDKKFYPVVELNNKIVGLAELELDPFKERNLWVKFVSIDPEFQGRRYSSKLVERIFQFAKENNYSLEMSSYSEKGKEKIKKVIDRMASETGVKIIAPYI